MIALVVAFTVLLLGGQYAIGSAAQAMGIGLVIAVAIGLIGYRGGSISAKSAPPLFWILSTLMPLQSVVVGLFRATYFQVVYGIAFAIVVLSCRVIALSFGIRRIADIYIAAAAMMMFVCIAFESPALVDSLTVTIADTGLLRFSPFDNHPNLVGHIFGIAAVVAAITSLEPQISAVRLTRVGIALGAAVMVLAASSRGGLFSMLISILIGVAYWLRGQYGKKATPYIAIGFLGFFMLVAGFLITRTENLSYLIDILQLDSSDRGIVDSGLSGRLSTWPIVLSKIADDGWAILVGFGFRSWDPWTEGDLTIDNGFVELIHDFGYFTAILVIAQLLFLIRMKNQGSSSNVERALALAITIFTLFESVVARYTFGIGNPASIFSLLFFCSTSAIASSTKDSASPSIDKNMMGDSPRYLK